MCGIAGILNFDGRQVESTVIKRMTDSIAHRGPDSEGCWLDGPVGLGHRRLSIIDLSDQASQPMVSRDKQTVIVFNGEIYNYKELASELEKRGLPCQTHSDTEVILNLYKLYGTGCLEYLRGMFAFVIWDISKKRLFVARDRVGIKPLYYLRSRQGFVFGSEIKAVALSGYSDLSINMDAVAGFMRFLVVPQPESIFKDIRKLEPGKYLIITPAGNLCENTYWSLATAPAEESSKREETCISDLDAALKNSINYHMVADVPVGAFLSGGLDSSAIVSLMREREPNQQIDAFSIIFPGQEKYDEDKYAREVARLKGLNYHTDTIDESFLDDIALMTWHLDEPFSISSAYATFYLAKSAARETKVVLTGDGGDELFAGYEGYNNNTYQINELLSGFFSTTFQVAFFLSRITGLKSASLNRILTGLRRRSGTEGLRYSEQVAQSSLHASSIVLNHDVFFHGLKSWEGNLIAQYYDQLSSPDILKRKLYAEFKTRLVDEMLMKVDRMTMAHSLEARVPLLDHEVVELAFRTPSSMKLHSDGGKPVTKYILKKYMEKYLPSDIIYRKKQGFNIPVSLWIKGDFLDSVREKLLDGNLQKQGIIERDGLEKLIKSQSYSGHNYNSMLMLLLAFENWIDVYQSRVGRISFN